MKQPDQVVWPVLALATLFSGVAVGGELKGPTGACEAGGTLGPRVSEGETITGRVVISRVADIGGVEVTFATSPPGYLEIPAVRVAGGQARAEVEFRVKGKRAQRNTSVTITAATPSGLPGAKTATVEVLAPPEPVSFVATPTGGRVTLSRAVFVPSTLTLSTKPAGLASVPATVVVRSGEASADVAVTAIPPVPVEPTEITVVAQGPTASAELKTSVAWNGTINMTDATKPGPPYTIIGGTTKRFGIRANPAVRTPLRVDLSTALPMLRIPASVTIDPARGGTTVEFDITATAVTARDVGGVQATARGKQGGAQIIVDPR